MVRRHNQHKVVSALTQGVQGGKRNADGSTFAGRLEDEADPIETGANDIGTRSLGMQPGGDHMNGYVTAASLQSGNRIREHGTGR